MNILPNTLTFRLTLWYASAFIIFVLFAFIALYLSMNTILDNRIDEDLNEDIAEFKELYESEGIKRVIREIGREVKPGEEGTVFLRLLNSKGDQLFSSDMSNWAGLSTDKTIVKALSTEQRQPLLVTEELSGHEYPTRIIYGLVAPDVVLQVGESLEDKLEIMELLLFVFAVMLSIVIPVASGVGWLVARQAVCGINEVSNAALDIEKGNLDRRVAVTNQRDEIQQLADTFNSMAERIRKLISEMREMIDNIAHDLRSPLARIRAISEATLSGAHTETQCRTAAADTLEECDRLIQLINTTLDVAEAEAGVADTENTDVNITKLAEDACELFEPLAEQRHIRLSVTLEPDCRLHGNQQYLQRMLVNILDNALKYTPPEGKIQVDLEKISHGIRIAVADTGIGIPPSEQHRVFERFYRCDQSRTKDGCGLGLSFARAVARAHGGDITLLSEPSKFSTFTITFPGTPTAH